MTLLIVAPDLKTDRWVEQLRKIDGNLDIRVWPDTGDVHDVRFALAWTPPPGELRRYPRLACIASLGVGVDHILKDPDLPEGVPVTRVIDPSMSQYMSEYVIMAVLNHVRRSEFHRAHQAEGRWRPKMPMLACDTRIGVMGLGQLGGDLAAKLVALGFPVTGWSRSPRKLARVETFHGPGGLDRFLAGANILVCLLPLTPETRNILCERNFRRLPAGAYVINVARGGHLVESDLIAEIDSGHLAGACLDVFRVEPLPADHPFWHHPKITVTPHVSSITNPNRVAPQVVENYHRVMAGQTPLHLVDVNRGY